MTHEEVQKLADRLVGQLERWEREQNRGPLARLRRGLSESTHHEAWPVLGRLFGDLAIGHPVFEVVAGCFALYPAASAPDLGNFGDTMREVMGKDKMWEAKEPHARFRRLLACSSRDEICGYIHHAVRLAKSREVPVNYRKLFADLWWWNTRTKIEWAKAYWQVPADAQGLSLEGMGRPIGEEPVLVPE
jgi:CRISPR type I-E-associated protein CasB/Cse2